MAEVKCPVRHQQRLSVGAVDVLRRMSAGLICQIVASALATPVPGPIKLMGPPFLFSSPIAAKQVSSGVKMIAPFLKFNQSIELSHSEVKVINNVIDDVLVIAVAKGHVSTISGTIIQTALRDWFYRVVSMSGAPLTQRGSITGSILEAGFKVDLPTAYAAGPDVAVSSS